MKKYSLLLTLLLSTWLIQSCNSNTNDSNSVDSANEMNENKEPDNNNMGMTNDSTGMGTMAVMEDDSKFMVKAAAGGMAEVELSQLAQQKATNERVKAFATMMVQDHTKANNELKALAATKNVTLPAAMDNDHQEDLNDLSKKSGADFDKAYVNMMVDDHKKDVDLFDDCTKMDKGDSDVKAWATKTLPTLRSHLAEIQKLDDMVKK